MNGLNTNSRHRKISQVVVGSLDTHTSSMLTSETDNNAAECSTSLDFADCPFLGHSTYVPEEEILRHSLGPIYIARDKNSGQKVVIKFVDRGASVGKHLADELMMHRKCASHPFFTHLLDVFLTQRHMAIVLEYIPGGNVLEYVDSRKQISEGDARLIFQQLIAGIIYMHLLGTKYREINLSNKFLSLRGSAASNAKDNDDQGNKKKCVHPNGFDHGRGRALKKVNAIPQCIESDIKPGYTTLKIQNFSYSKSDQINSDPHSALGSLPYTAPEVLDNTMHETKKANVWSLGVALYKMTVGFYPSEDRNDTSRSRKNVQTMLEKIAHADHVIPKSLSSDLQDLLSRMLVKDPSHRMTLDDITKHPWFLKDLDLNIEDLNKKALDSIDSSASMTEEALLDIISKARAPLRILDLDSIDDIADEIINEQKADELFEELLL